MVPLSQGALNADIRGCDEDTGAKNQEQQEAFGVFFEKRHNGILEESRGIVKARLLITINPNSELEPLRMFFNRDILVSAALIPLFSYQLIAFA